MGYLQVGDIRVDFDDRVLAHIEVVIVSKLRRRESFTLSWRDSLDTGGGRTILWVDASHHLLFHFEGSRPPTLNREWVEHLSASASTASGLAVVDEEGQPVTATLRQRGI